MQVLYTLQTLWPTDHSNPDHLEAVDWEKRGSLPFLPVAGMLIDCGDGDFREIREVYWSVATPSEVTVCFADDDDRRQSVSRWQDCGWITKDLAQP